jgi:tetratricopeptide (TPR) repeat protein
VTTIVPHDAAARAHDLLADAQVDAAFAVLGPALTATPGDPTLLVLAARGHLQGGRPHDAWTAAAAAISVAPHDAVAYRLLAQAAAWLDHATAWRAAQRSVELAPWDAESHTVLAQILLTAPGPDSRSAARHHAEEAARLAPGDPAPLVLLGRLAEQRGSERAQRKAYQRAVDLDPTNEPALAALQGLDPDTVDRVRYGCVLERNRPHPRRPGEESLLTQLAMRRLVAFGFVLGMPLAVLVAHLLAGAGAWTAWGMGAAAPVVATATLAWGLGPTIAARWLAGRRTWWLLDGRIVRGRRRGRIHQRLVICAVIVWSLIGLGTTIAAAEPDWDEPSRYDGGQLDARADDPTPWWTNPLLGKAVSLVAIGVGTGIAKLAKRR